MRTVNDDQPFHPINHYAAVADREEGLILVNVDTLADGEPRNNFLRRALQWNPDGVLKGATHVTLGGHYAYVAADAGIVVVDLDDPLQPRLAARVAIAGARASALQFRYLFVASAAGLEVIDVTLPEKAHLVEGARVALADARRVYVARTYAYVAAGRVGASISYVLKAQEPRDFAQDNVPRRHVVA